MKFTFIISLSFALSSTCFSQKVNVIKIDSLINRINNNSDTTYIVNFWATWCAPCVKELPDFDSINKAYTNKKVKVLLVSLDFKENLEDKLLPFLKRNKTESEVVLLDESNGNYFIPKISKEWSGAIPATLLVNKKKGISLFFEKKVNFNFLKTKIDEILN